MGQREREHRRLAFDHRGAGSDLHGGAVVIGHALVRAEGARAVVEDGARAGALGDAGVAGLAQVDLEGFAAFVGAVVDDGHRDIDRGLAGGDGDGFGDQARVGALTFADHGGATAAGVGDGDRLGRWLVQGDGEGRHTGAFVDAHVVDAELGLGRLGRRRHGGGGRGRRAGLQARDREDGRGQHALGAEVEGQGRHALGDAVHAQARRQAAGGAALQAGRGRVERFVAVEVGDDGVCGQGLGRLRWQRAHRVRRDLHQAVVFRDDLLAADDLVAHFHSAQLPVGQAQIGLAPDGGDGTGRHGKDRHGSTQRRKSCEVHSLGLYKGRLAQATSRVWRAGRGRAPLGMLSGRRASGCVRCRPRRRKAGRSAARPRPSRPRLPWPRGAPRAGNRGAGPGPGRRHGCRAAGRC